MGATSSMCSVLPKMERSSEGQDAGPAFDQGGSLVRGPRKGPKRAGDREAERRRREADREVAAWLDEAISRLPKAQAYAEEVNIDEGHLSRLRSGEKAPAMRHLLGLRGHRDAVLAVTRPLLDSIEHTAAPQALPSLTELRETALAWMRAQDLAWRVYCDDMQRMRGWSREQIETALVSK
jgi:hypothetical protein